MAIKDLSAPVLDSDGDYVYDMGYLLSLNSLKSQVVERRFCVSFVVEMKFYSVTAHLKPISFGVTLTNCLRTLQKSLR